MVTAPPVANEIEDAWQCLKCGKRGGDFELLGLGKIKCSGCGAIHFVKSDGSIELCQV